MGCVLVTGGAGYIGSHMVICLLDAGEDVVVLDNLSTGHYWAVDPRAKLIVGDVRDPLLVTKTICAHGITEILHFAASTVVPESVDNPLMYYKNNTSASRSLLEASVDAGVRSFVFSSTAAVYGVAGLEPIGEDAPVVPLSPYGRSKLMTEMMLSDAGRAHGLRYGILRYFNVAGADPMGRSGHSTAQATHLIKVACQVALGLREHLDIFGHDYPTPDGTCVRDYIHVSDLVRAHLLLLGHLRGGGKNVTLNCGYGRGFSVQEVVETVKTVSGVDFPVCQKGPRPGDAAAVVACSDNIRSVLDWSPKHADLAEIVRSALAWEAKIA